MLNRSIHVWIVYVFGNFIFFTQFDCGEVLVIGFIVDAGLREAETKTEKLNLIVNGVERVESKCSAHPLPSSETKAILLCPVFLLIIIILWKR